MAERARYAPDFAAAAAMVGFGSLVGRRLGIRLKEKDDWTEHGNIWGMMVGLPSALKSPAMREGLAPLKRLQAGADKEAAEAMQDFNSQKIGVELRNKALRKTAEKAYEKDLEANPNLKFEEDPKPPLCRCYWTSDVTVEKLGEILSENPVGILIERDELSSWLTNLEDERNAVARGFFLSGWSGKEGYRFDRIGRGTTALPAFALSVIGGIQPGPLDRYVRGALSGVRADGLLQRFQLAVWPDTTAYAYVDRLPNMAARRGAVSLYERLDVLKGNEIGNQCIIDGLPVLHFDRVAQGMFAEWSTDFQTTQRRREANGEECSALSSHFGKYPGLVGKLALIIHVADRPDDRAISMTTLQKALAWLDYLKPHARRIYHAAGVPNVDAAKLLLNKIRNGHVECPFKARDVYRKGWEGLGDSEQVRAACFMLADYNYLRIRDNAPSGTGRPPDPVFEINPKAG
jgi:putative DNA primase/helicase